jgi:uncharacterized protein (DUF169 family)
LNFSGTEEKEEVMAGLAGLAQELERRLRLKNRIVAYRRLESAKDLDKIENVYRPNRSFTYCQVPFMVRVQGLTVGVTREDQMVDRCMRLHGLKDADEESMQRESFMLSTTWFGSPEEAMQQQKDYPRIPAGEAIVASPAIEGKFDPDVVSIYANPAQIMMIMCGLQKDKYEQFHFSFIGEGACADSLAQCYVSGKPALAIPCYGERALGQVADDEIVIALPPGEIERSIAGLKRLVKVGFGYPIAYIGGVADVVPILSQVYEEHSDR